MKLYKDFNFESAHYLPSAPPGHPNSRVHGHSFRARIWVEGEPDADSGLIVHLDDLSAAIEDAREALDHRMLNEVDGLEAPTLERITMWLWHRLANRLPGLTRIEVARDSCNEGCVYDGPEVPRAQMAAE
ncbi:MAG: 6-carboxytetrahydropterin synthase [Alphaproteobacteria bacterium]|nr:6-carboxytetrahydropterin synthase [Alphaproteobacteria bacterium]